MPRVAADVVPLEDLTMALKLQVNGEQRLLDPTPDPATLENVVNCLAERPLLVVAEHNGVIAPRNTWSTITVNDGDILEIVTIVGGGS